MLDSYFLNNIRTLFINKNYGEVIKLTNNLTIDEDIPSWFLNIIGISKNLQIKKTDIDVLFSLSLFEKAFLKEKEGLYGLEGLSNLIATTLTHLNNKNLKKEILNYLKLCEKYYLSSEKFFGNNEKFLIIGSNLFLFLLDQDKEKEILKKLLKSNIKKKDVIASRYLFLQNYLNSWSQKEHYDNARELNIFFSKLEILELDKINFNQNKKIRIGFVSKDLYENHSLCYFVSNIFKHCDKNLFEINVYSFASKDNPNLKKYVSKWHNLKSVDNQEVAKIIQFDKTQILIDLMGYTSGNRIGLFNTRICPIQISWLAYTNTLGFKNVDYLIADKNLIFKNEEQYYSEKVLMLENIWNAHSGFEYDRNFKVSPCIDNKMIHFGSFNNFKKISDETIEAWSSILKKKKNSKLILKSSFEVATFKILDKFKKFGVENQIEIFHRNEYNDFNHHLNLYDKIDIALDTFPYNGVTTTFEALWKGVPVITMSGFNFNSRCGNSILKNANLENLIAKDISDYVSKALLLSENFANLNKLRKKIFDEILDSPLFDAKAFAKDFYNTLSKVYKKLS